MKTKRLSYLLVSIILAFCACMLVLVNTAPAKANADGAVFQMVNGASVKINNDGGIRWKVKMDETTKNNIVDNDNVSLKFIVTYADFFERVTDDKYYETLTGGENKRAYIIPVDEAKIYKMGDLYYANACLTNIEQGYADNYVALAVIDNAGSYQYATVNGLGVEDESFSINKTKTNLYGLLNLAVLDTTDDYATEIFGCDAYEAWFGTENYPIKISSVSAYENLIKNINKGISYGTLEVEFAESVNTNDATVELDAGKTLPQNSYTARTVNFYAEDRQTLIDTVVVKDRGTGAVVVAPEAPAKDSTVSTTYSFNAWVKADGSQANLNSVKESMDVYPSYNEGVREYTITWNDENGNLIKTTQAPYGFEPNFDGTPTKASTGLEVYEFTGWYPALEGVTGDATYQATFGVKDTLIVTGVNTPDYVSIDRVTDSEKVPNGYNYAWEAYAEGDAIESFYINLNLYGNFKAGVSYRFTINGVWPYGWTTSSCLYHIMYNNGSKSGLLQGDGWIIEKTFDADATEFTLSNIWVRVRNAGGGNDGSFSGKSSICMSAKVEEILYKTVNWEVRGEIVLSQQVEVGLVPEFTGTIEPYEDNGVYKAFTGWDKEITAVTEDVTYVAEFTNAYLISWYGYNDTLIYSEYVAEGVTPVFDQSKLTAEHKKPAEGMTVYGISGWDKEITAVTENVSYNAVFTAKPAVEANKIDDENYWLEGSTITYTEDASQLPAGATSGFVVATSNYVQQHNFAVVNTLNGNFKAGKTYAINIKIQVYTGWYDMCYNTSGAWGSYDKQIKLSIWGGTGADRTDFTVEKLIEQDTDKLFVVLDVTNGYTAVNARYSYSISFYEITYHTVTWVDADRTVLETDENVGLYHIPTYDGAEPSNAPDDGNDYYFAGWSPDVSAVTGDVTYTAVYKIAYPYEATSVASTSANYLAGVNYRYTTDSSELPTGATSAFVVEASLSKGFHFKHIIRDDFKAGTTYRFTLRAEFFNLGGWEWDTIPLGSIYIDTTATEQSGTPLGNNKIQSAQHNWGAAYKAKGYTFDITVSEDCEEIVFTSWVQINQKNFTGPFDFKMSFNIVHEEVTYHTVTWLDEDGTELEVDENVEVGTIPTYDGVEPTKAAGEFEYEFAGWDKEVTAVTGDVTYTAVYKTLYPYEAMSTNHATYDMDGVTYRYTTDSSELPSGATSAFVVEGTYTNIAYRVKNIIRGDFKAGSTYRFTIRAKYFNLGGWDNLNNPMVSMYIDYTGTYKMPTGVDDYFGNFPPQASPTLAYTSGGLKYEMTATEDCDEIIFITWLRSREDKTVDFDFKVSFSIVYEEIKYHTVTWLDEDGTELEVDENVEVGTIPTFDGETPTKVADGDVKYVFDGWDKEIVEVTNDVTYIAKYRISRSYEVTNAPKTVYWAESGTITYTEDANLLHSSATSGYVIASNGTTNSNNFNIINTLNGNFEAGKTYAVTIMLKYISGSGSNTELYINRDATQDNTNEEFMEAIILTSWRPTVMGTVNFEVTETTDKLQFLLGLRFATSFDVQYSISVTVTEVVAE